MAAPDAVRRSPLDIAELLEMTISHLPPGEIARCQRTSKFWRNVVRGSPRLQTLQFLKPVERFDTLVWTLDKSPKRRGYEPTISPVLKPLSEVTFAPEKSQYPIVEINPLLLRMMTEDSMNYKASTELTICMERLHALTPGPWLDMLLSQPPVQVVTANELTANELLIWAPKDGGKGGLTFRTLLKQTIRQKEEYSGKLAQISYEQLWQERNELRGVETFQKAYRNRRIICGVPVLFSPQGLLSGWTGHSSIRKLMFGSVVGEHTRWVQQARRGLRNGVKQVDGRRKSGAESGVSDGLKRVNDSCTVS